jgi:hypothetical protein
MEEGINVDTLRKQQNVFKNHTIRNHPKIIKEKTTNTHINLQPELYTHINSRIQTRNIDHDMIKSNKVSSSTVIFNFNSQFHPTNLKKYNVKQSQQIPIKKENSKQQSRK